MRAILYLISFVLLPWLPALADVPAGRRVALVVGNGNYVNTAQLSNPARDAGALADQLKQLGFQVFTQNDVDQEHFAGAIDEFLSALQGAEAGLFFFAGHGLQIQGQNFLLSTSATGKNELLVPSEGMELSTIISQMEARAPLALVFVDACRDNPFSAKLLQRNPSTARTLGVTRGLAPVNQHGRNTMIVFATATNQTAADGDAVHSPFTRALLRHIPTPGLEVSAMLKRVTNDVLEETSNKQQPEVIASMSREFYFQLRAASEGQQSFVKTSTPTPDLAALEATRAYAFAQRLKTSEAYRYFVEAYPHSPEANSARTEIAKLESGKPEITAPPKSSSLPTVTSPGGSESDEKELSLNKASRSGIQLILTSLGYDPGNVNGYFSSDTRTAIRSFQYALKHEPTGYLNRAEYDYLAARKQQAEKIVADVALRLSSEDLPETADPRLKKAVAALGGLPVKFGFLGKKLYIAVAIKTPWDAALKLARAAGGEFAMISSKRENDFVFRLISRDLQFWYTVPAWDADGGFFTEGPFFGVFQEGSAKSSTQGWKLMDGRALTYSNWSPYKPNKLRLKHQVGVAAFGAERKVPAPTWEDQPVFSGEAPGFVMEIN